MPQHQVGGLHVERFVVFLLTFDLFRLKKREKKECPPPPPPGEKEGTRESPRERKDSPWLPRVVDLIIIIIIINRLKDVLSLFKPRASCALRDHKRRRPYLPRPGLSNTPETSRRLLRVTASPGLSLFRSQAFFLVSHQRVSKRHRIFRRVVDVQFVRRVRLTDCPSRRRNTTTTTTLPPAELVVVFGWLKSSLSSRLRIRVLVNLLLSSSRNAFVFFFSFLF